jgi:hypothetical protein
MEMSQGNSLCSYLKQNVFFQKQTEEDGKTNPVWGLVPVGGGGYKDRV